MAQVLVRREVHVDEHQVEALRGLRSEDGVDVAFANAEPRVAAELFGERDQPVAEEAHDLGQEPDDLHPPDPVGLEHLADRVPQAQAAHQHRQVAAGVPREGLGGQRALGHRVVAAHQELEVECDLGDERAGPREQLAAAEAELSKRRRFAGEDLEIGGAQRGADRRF